METLRMDYRFTALLIVMFIILTVFAKPAYPRNEYLNEYGARCGDFETRVEKEDRNNDYRHYSNNNNYDSDSENYRLSFTYRKYLGVDCKTINENVKLKQQLELMKMCSRVNSNPSILQNENFKLLVSKCTGITPSKIDNRPEDSGSAWDGLKDKYKKENPGIKLMGDKFLTLPVPTND